MSLPTRFIKNIITWEKVFSKFQDEVIKDRLFIERNAISAITDLDCFHLGRLYVTLIEAKTMEDFQAAIERDFGLKLNYDAYENPLFHSLTIEISGATRERLVKHYLAMTSAWKFILSYKSGIPAHSKIAAEFQAAFEKLPFFTFQWLNNISDGDWSKESGESGSNFMLETFRELFKAQKPKTLGPYSLFMDEPNGIYNHNGFERVYKKIVKGEHLEFFKTLPIPSPVPRDFLRKKQATPSIREKRRINLLDNKGWSGNYQTDASTDYSITWKLREQEQKEPTPIRASLKRCNALTAEEWANEMLQGPKKLKLGTDEVLDLNFDDNESEEEDVPIYEVPSSPRGYNPRVVLKLFPKKIPIHGDYENLVMGIEDAEHNIDGGFIPGDTTCSKADICKRLDDGNKIYVFIKSTEDNINELSSMIQDAVGNYANSKAINLRKASNCIPQLN